MEMIGKWQVLWQSYQEPWDHEQPILTVNGIQNSTEVSTLYPRGDFNEILKF